MALGNPFRKKDGAINPVAIGVVVVLVLIVALGGSLAVSASRAHGLVENAREAFVAARASLDEGNFEDAYASARSAAENVSALPKELEGPQWSIAAVLPVLGTDVQTAREMSSIAGKLADEAVLPVFDQWDSITQELTGRDLLHEGGQVATFLSEELPKFGETLAHAEQTVYECEGRANNLPETHFSQLNDAERELKDAMASVGDMLRSIDQMVAEFDPASLLGEALNRIDFGSLLGKTGLSGLLGR